MIQVPMKINFRKMIKNLILNTGLNFNDSLVVSKGARIQQGLKLVGKLDLRDSLTVKGIISIPLPD